MFSVNEFIISTAASFAICCSVIPVLRVKSKGMGLIDKPGGRKQHSGDVPIVGGLAIYLSVLATGALLGQEATFFLPLLLSLPIVISGLIDDRQALSPTIRIPIQIFSAISMVYFGGIEINNIGNVAGLGNISFSGLSAYIFTAICAVGVINSINMIDGVDGLSGSLIALSLLPMILFAELSGDSTAVTLLASLTTAIFAFLLYNCRLLRKHASVFLGDTGSTFLGFILVWHLIKYTQGDNAVLSPISAGWILGLPLADTVVVMIRRVLKKQSPLLPDRRHLHHRLLDAGLGVNQTVLTMLGIQFTFIAVGLSSNIFTDLEPIFFWAFVGLTAVHFIYTPRIIGRLAAAELSGKRLIPSKR